MKYRKFSFLSDISFQFGSQSYIRNIHLSIRDLEMLYSTIQFVWEKERKFFCIWKRFLPWKMHWKMQCNHFKQGRWDGPSWNLIVRQWARERLTYRDATLHCAPKNHNLLFGLTSCFAIRERQSFVKKKPDPQNKTTSQSYLPYDKDMNKLYRYFSLKDFGTDAIVCGPTYILF